MEGMATVGLVVGDEMEGDHNIGYFRETSRLPSVRTIRNFRIVASRVSSPVSKIFLGGSFIVGILTSKSVAIIFWISRSFHPHTGPRSILHQRLR